MNVQPDPAGAPAAVAGRPVATIRARWRIDDEWWRDRPISRLYYALLLERYEVRGTRYEVREAGLLLTVFQDLVTGKWFQQRY